MTLQMSPFVETGVAPLLSKQSSNVRIYRVAAGQPLRDALLNGEIFYGVREAQVIEYRCMHHYNATWPHSRPGYKLPVPEFSLASRVQNLHFVTH